MVTAIFTRESTAHAFKFERATDRDSAELAARVNAPLGVETVLVDTRSGETIPQFLDSCNEPFQCIDARDGCSRNNRVCPE